MWTPERVAIGKELNIAIERGDVAQVRAICANNSWVICDHKWDGERIWLDRPVQRGNLQMVELLLDLGFNVDALRLPEKSSALSYAIDFDQFEIAKLLLSRGADPDYGRAIIGTLKIGDSRLRRELLELLIHHDVSVNQLFDVYGDKDNQFTALDWAKDDPETAAYLRAHGAKTADELKRAQEQGPAQRGTSATS
jgi:ankyrin repeat protein